MGALTERQLQCLRLSATMTDKDIARHLGLSPHTVSLHIREANRKLGVADRRSALRRLAENPLYASSAMAPPPAVAPAEPVAEAGPVSPSDGQEPRRRSLYDRYVSLGDWRTPPRIAGSRLPVIVIWACVWLGVAAALAMALSVMDTIGQLR
jgi:DNA-binding CsgD family transcriptional regulator